ncbi:MAG: APC family permease [Chitinophagales bacterium]
MSKHTTKLGQLASTAISGNDISSSVLYVSALAIATAGVYAPVTLLIVAFVLYFFRKIYGEVVGALPLNGGAYNALLNTTSKQMASIAATLTLLSYMATAVISAEEAMHYLSKIWHFLDNPTPGPIAVFFPHFVEIATVILLCAFALLVINGISESAMVAIIIFIFHLSSMVLLMGASLYFIFNNGLEMFNLNWDIRSPNMKWAIFMGFSVSMLGISGFESSANFVEEQKQGVFPKTLRNMWIVVSVLNPLMAFFALAMFSQAEVTSQYQEGLLAAMANLTSGSWLKWIISIDAVLVLSGAVLTSFVGVTGLMERMTLDRILPNSLLKRNKKGISYRLILVFLLLSISVLIITKGDVVLLAGVYTISFLAVMTLFVIGNVLLKFKRAKLPRPEVAPYYGLIIAFTGVVVALIGNIVNPEKPDNFKTFIYYFVPAIIFVYIMLNRIGILRLFLSFVKYINTKVIHTINDIVSQEFVFFTKGDNLSNLNKVMLYIKDNEHTRKIKIVTVLKEEEIVSENLQRDIEFLGREYPEIDIDFKVIHDKFGPKLINRLSKEWDVPVNFMFIGSPGDTFPYRIEELGGVRLIM